MKKLFICVFIISFLSTCTKNDFRDSIVGSYKVINELNDCQYAYTPRDSTIDTIQIKKEESSDDAITISSRSFVQTINLYSKNIPVINELYINSNSTFGRENYIDYLSPDSINFIRGRYSYCKGGNITFNSFFGHKIK